MAGQPDRLPGVVYVVDDDPDVRFSITWLLESLGQSVRAFPSASAFRGAPREDQPGCIVLDLRLSDSSGLAVQQVLRAAGDETPVVFISGVGDVSSAAAAMKAGALDFLTKPIEPDALIACVRGAIVRDAERRSRAARMAVLQARFARLTPRQRQVLPLLAQGWTNKRIAQALGTVVQTIKVHRAALMQRLEVTSLAELVRLVDVVCDQPWALVAPRSEITRRPPV